MESTGEPDRIQISDTTAQILMSSGEPLYFLTSREPIVVKGIDHLMSNYWVDNMTPPHAAKMEIITNNIMAITQQLVSDFDSTPDNIGKFPHLVMPSLGKNDAIKKLIRQNSSISLNSMTSGDIPTGNTSEADINRIIQEVCQNQSVLSDPTDASQYGDAPLKVLIICGLSKMRVNIFKLIVDSFGDSVQFCYADNANQAMEKVLSSVHNFSIVIVDELIGNVNNSSTALLAWLKNDMKVAVTITFSSNSVPNTQATKSKAHVDFVWSNSKLPTKQELSFAFFKSSNNLAVRLITKQRVTDVVEKPNTMKVMIIIRDLSKSKMISKQVQTALSKLPIPVEVFVANNGSEAIDRIYDSPFINIIMIDNALGSSVGDVTVPEILGHLQYAIATKESIIIGLTTSTNTNSDYMIKCGVDFVWPLPLPSYESLSARLRKFVPVLALP